MTIREYITEYLPNRFGVHPAFKTVAEMIFVAEQHGQKAYAHNNFATPRERAALAIPYQIDDLKERERVLNVLELVICKHREECHGENWDKRIIELQESTVLTQEEIDMLAQPRGFWSG